MKTNYLLRYTKVFVTSLMVFLWATVSLNAQCPTITNQTPPPICNGSGYTLSNLSADYATDNGNGIVWYNAATGGNGLDPNQLVQQGVYYIDDNSGSCGTDPRESITISFQVEPVPPGGSLDKFYCSNENATIQDYIDDALALYIPLGGSVSVYYDLALTTQANSTDTVANGIVNYYIVFDDITCTSQIKLGKTIESISPADPTPPSTQEFCSDSNSTIGDLDPGTAATFIWYNNVDGFGNPIPPALLPSTALLDGATYYVQVDEPLCDSNAIPVTVTINDPFDPGTSGSLEYCNDNVPTTDFDLFDELGAPKDTNGTWSNDASLTTTNGNLGTVNISTLTTPGVYTFTYTVPANGACPENSADVTITINETFTSGDISASNPATYCEQDLPTAFDLFTLLDNEDPGGQWTQGTLSTDPIVSSPIDLTMGAFTPGTYNFTYTQNLLTSCDDNFRTVQVVVLEDPNAGVADNQTFCENNLTTNSPFDLFDALTGPYDSGGTWTDATSTTISDPLNIDITGFTVAGSPYEFTYTVDNGTCTDDETISITIVPAPESGTANPPVEFCEGVAPASFDLYTLISGESGTGTWTNNNTSTMVADPSNLDLSGFMAAGSPYSFTFDIDPIGTCDDVDVVVSVIINPLPNTGTPNNPPPFCENDPALSNTAFDLFTLLNGPVDSGGTWSDDSATPVSGALSGNILDLSQLVIGTYNFTYSITDTNGCSNSSTVVITIEDAPESGTANPPAEFCEGVATASYNLFDLLTGEDQTGTWYLGNDNTGSTTTNLVDLSVLTAATYNFTYDVDMIGSCDDELVTVSVIINPLPNTGTPNNPPPFCENDPALSNTTFDLFTLLNAPVDTGGTWSDDSVTAVSGALSGNVLDLSQLVVNSYNFTYSITDTNGCSNSSTVVVTIEDAPESGTANTPEEFCLAEVTVGQTYNLFDLLTDEDQTGTWNDDDISGALSGNTVTLDGLAQGTYNFTFDVDAIGSCDDVDVTVSIIINDTPGPTATSPQEFCDTATVADLVVTGTTIQWYDVSTGGTPLAGTTALVDAQIYYATQTDATTGCESSIRTEVIATIYETPDAGNLSTTPILSCNNTTIDLNLGLDGTQDTSGTWYEGSDNTGTVVVNPTTYNVTGFSTNTYQFTYYVTASAPCIDDSITITITIEEPLTSGTSNGDLAFCSSDPIFDLDSNLTGASSGGEWTFNSASVSNLFDPSTVQSGTYTYTTANSCGSSSTSFDIIVTQAPNAGTDNSILICVIDGVTDLFPLLGTSAQSGGTWSPALPSGTGEFDPNADAAGVYTYTVAAVSPCTTNASASITVTVDDSTAPVVVNLNPEYCLVDNPTVSNLDSALTITGTVTWYEDAALTIVANSTDSLIDGEDYYATQTNSSGCESSTNVQVTVTVNDTPTPILFTSNQELCINDNPTISELTSNIDYDSSMYDAVWYDADSGGFVVSEGTSLSNGATYYAVLVDLATGCESSVRLAVTPDLTSCGKLIIPDGFSPNGDGVNDTFDMDNLGIIHPNFEIEIYNRNGNIVYKGNANTPRFNGKSNQSGTVGNGDLPVGVYFYIFSYNDGENKTEQGRLYLSR